MRFDVLHLRAKRTSARYGASALPDDAGGSSATAPSSALVRRAAIAGVGAWTAPMIVDSLASPALATVQRCAEVSRTIRGLHTVPTLQATRHRSLTCTSRWAIRDSNP